jgi:hypothetical protein
MAGAQFDPDEQTRLGAQQVMVGERISSGVGE